MTTKKDDLGYDLLIPFGFSKEKMKPISDEIAKQTGYSIWIVKHTRKNRNWRKEIVKEKKKC